MIDPERIPHPPAGGGPDRAQIAAAATVIAESFDPERIVLFGSRAYGTPRSDSDVDLMVVMRTPLPAGEQVRQIYHALPPRHELPIQILVRDPDDIAHRLATGDFFIEDVILKGITLYARNGMDKLPPTGTPIDRSDDDGSQLSPAAVDWLQVAEKDAATARFLLTAPVPNFNLVCFLAQQSTEKNLKALLQHHHIRFPRTHDLPALAALALPLVPALATHTEALKTLTTCAVDARYPGAVIDAAQADAALRTMTTVRDLVQAALAWDEGHKSGLGSP